MERGFSESGLLLSEDKSMTSERTLNAKLIISDAMKKYDHLTHKVPITQELIAMGQGAHRSYKNYLENQRRLKEEAEQKEALEAENRANEAAVLHNIAKEIKNLDTLKKEVESVKKCYQEATANTEAIQTILNYSYKNNVGSGAINQLIASIDKLKKKEKLLRQQLDKAIDELLQINANVIKSTLNKNTLKKSKK